MGLIADIARYHLLVSLQRWAGPALAILCAHEHIRAGALSLPPPQVPDPEPLTEEQETTRRIRLAALKVIVQASASNLHGLIDDVDKRRLTVPAAERRLLATLPPAEEFARDVIARLEASLAQDTEGAALETIQAKHCNQYEHADDCPNGHLMHTNKNAREGKTRPRKQHSNRKPREPKEPFVQHPSFLSITQPVDSFQKLKKSLAQKAKSYGIPGRGYRAPGMDEEFFISMGTSKEMRNGDHIAFSSDKISHLTAAEHVAELWEQSYPLDKERDRYRPHEESSIEWAHKRVAYMNLQGKRYEVKITAKQFKGNTPNLIYQVQTRAIK